MAAPAAVLDRKRSKSDSWFCWWWECDKKYKNQIFKPSPQNCVRRIYKMLSLSGSRIWSFIDNLTLGMA